MKRSLILIACTMMACQFGCGDYQPAAAPSGAQTSAPTAPSGQASSTPVRPQPTQAEPPPAPSITTQALVPGAFVDLENPPPAHQRAAQAVAVPPTPPQPAAPAAGNEPERVKAEAGVGKKGRGYGGGIITEPVRIRFQAEQRIDFMNMQHTLDLYKAEHDRFPRTQDEFMKEIIQAGAIQLPDLPEGERYVYDPKTGELMVERPAPGAQAQP